MPIISPEKLSEAPKACKIVGFGVTRLKKGQDANLELHFHDGDELWFMVDGKLRVTSEGKEYTVSAGEALFTEAGNEHTILEVMEDSVVVWCEQDLRGQCRPGHLHRPEDVWP